MKSTDRLLIGIVAGVVVLVAAGFAVALLRPEPAYKPDDTPEGVTHNYLLALRLGDLDRAYGYLSPTLPGYPPLASSFERDVRNNDYIFGQDETSALEVVSSQISGLHATVSVRKTTFNQGGLFESSEYSRTFEVELKRDASSNAWKLIEADAFWLLCWTNRRGC